MQMFQRKPGSAFEALHLGSAPCFYPGSGFIRSVADDASGDS